MTRRETAIAVLQNGGFIKQQLETGWQGWCRYAIRLYDQQYCVVKGVGPATLYQIIKELHLREHKTWFSESCTTRWELPTITD